MIETKPLKPSLRENKRYVSFEVLKPTDFEIVSKAINKALKQLIGNLGMAKAGLIVIRNKYKNNKGVLRINRKYVDHIRAAFTLSDLPIRSLKASGIINKLEVNK